MSIYVEKSRELKVLCSCDVVVIGGGAAGCAAAIGAANLGVDTLLVNKDGYLGGATVSQLVGHILSTNCVDFQGIWHDWFRTVKERNGIAGTGVVKQRKNLYRGGVNPEIVKFAWEDMMKRAGVKLLYHTYFSEVIIEDGVVSGIIVETKGGRFAIYAKRVIDTTGDGLVCAKAGVPYEYGDGRNKYNQALTTVFRMGNVDMKSRSYDQDYLAKMQKFARSEEIAQQYSSEVVRNGRVVTYSANDTVKFSVANGRKEMNVFPSRVLRVDTTDPWDMTRAEMEGREQAWQCSDFIKKYIDGFENSYLVDTAAHIGIRDSRRIKGIAVATMDDALNLNKYEDSIARSSWEIDIWPGDSYSNPAVPYNEDFYLERQNKTENGDYFDVRYGCIVAYGVDNLLVAGRCLSAERQAQASIRIQQTCQSTGQAAGVAAAISILEDTTPRQLDSKLVVSYLNKIRGETVPAVTAE